MVTKIEESKDLSTLPLDELIGNLKVYEVVLEKDSEISKVKKEKYKSLALKARKVSSDEEVSCSKSEDEEYAMAVRDFKKFFRRRGKFVRQPHDDKKNFRKIKEDKKEKEDRSDSEDDSKKEEICLMALDNNEVRLKVKLEPDEWIKDGRCSRHMTGNKDLFLSYKAIDGDDTSTLWHRRLGHTNMRLIQSLSSKELVRNLPKLKFENHFCDACNIGKQVPASHKAKNMVSTTKCLELLHMDLFGPSAIQSYEAFDHFEILSKKIQVQKGCPIISIRLDHGREFDNEVQFGAFGDANGITHNFLAPLTPQSNGVVERKNRTLQEMSRTMLNEQSIPQKFWYNVVNTSTYILNRILIRPFLGKTPYELFKGKNPSLEHFKVFGSKCFILNTKDYLTKFDPKSTEGIFLGYSPNSKAYLILNKETMRVEESLNVRFDKSLPPKSSPLVDDDIIENQIIENQIEDIEIKENEPLNKEIVNIKETKDHPIDSVIGNEYSRKDKNEAKTDKIEHGIRRVCSWCGGPFNGGNCRHCTNVSFRDEFVCNPDSISNDETPDFSYPPSQPQTSSFDQFHCFGCGDPLEGGVRCQRCTCNWCRYGLREEICWFCASRDGNSSIDAPNPNSLNDPPNIFTHPPQPQYESYSCELCGNDAHYGYDCPPRVPLVYEQKPCYNQNFGDNYYPQNSPSFPQQYLNCEKCKGPYESFQCQPMNQNYFEPNPSYSGFDQPSQYPIDQSPPQEMSIQDMEDLKQQYLDEMQSIINQIQIKDYRNERIDIRYRRECEIKIDELKGKFNGMSIEINKKKELRQLEQAANLKSTIPLNEIVSQIPPSSPLVLPIEDPEDSLIMRDEDLSTIPEKESDEVIKSSVEDLVPIPSESEDTSGSDGECDLSSCNDFSPINVSEEKSVTFSNPLFDSNDDFTSSDDELLSDEDIPKDNVKIYSNPLFEFDDEYIFSDVNPLFDEVLEDIEREDSYVSKLDEPDLLVTPLSKFNEDEYFDSGGEFVLEEIEASLTSDLIPLGINDNDFDPEGDILLLEKLLNDDPSSPLPQKNLILRNLK
ncbi:retrovirus-related pol polyprotein from transposon TNT 1-94 [Tanacetum coccineum]|uniref:Retrovirus-related pol polyprotein from transposon TNT 1-94 n=1 Tax=Tanacetum coccineum TaxID=301880 RepID=A0ABQ5D5S7_9ASTR